jgi:thiol-disulfide isomerase/thioredoxin
VEPFAAIPSPHVRLALALALCAPLAACAHAGRARPAPPATIEAETPGGDRVTVGGPGPVRLVELWATWCAPCRAVAPRVREILGRHPAVEAYAISIDEDATDWRSLEAGARPAGRLLHLPGGGAAAARRGIDRLPLFLVLDPRGRLTAVVEGSSQSLGARLERALALAGGERGEP